MWPTKVSAKATLIWFKHMNQNVAFLLTCRNWLQHPPLKWREKAVGQQQTKGTLSEPCSWHAKQQSIRRMQNMLIRTMEPLIHPCKLCIRRIVLKNWIILQLKDNLEVSTHRHTHFIQQSWTILNLWRSHEAASYLDFYKKHGSALFSDAQIQIWYPKPSSKLFHNPATSPDQVKMFIAIINIGSAVIMCISTCRKQWSQTRLCMWGKVWLHSCATMWRPRAVTKSFSMTLR